MTTYINNAVPNAWLVRGVIITPISVEDVIEWFTNPDLYADYDDNIVPRKWKGDVVSIVGHEESAKSMTQLLTAAVGATAYGRPVDLVVEWNRERPAVDLGHDHRAVCAVFVPPRRLKEGEQWSDADFAENTRWVMVEPFIW